MRQMKNAYIVYRIGGYHRVGGRRQVGARGGGELADGRAVYLQRDFRFNDDRWSIDFTVSVS